MRLVCPPVVALRPEPFGGLAFHRERGITLELDHEAYALLSALREPREPRRLALADARAGSVLAELLRLGFLVPADGRPAPPGHEAGLDSPPALPGAATLPAGTLSAPEVVHLTITSRCNLACLGCYTPRHVGAPELTTDELLRLIDELAALQVFQLAVGGGEPLLRPDLLPVLRHARSRGIVPSLTTNGTLLTWEFVCRLEEAGVGQVNVSYNGPTGGGARPDCERRAALRRALSLLARSSLVVGVNLLVTPAIIPDLAGILHELGALGAPRVTILGPKPEPTGVWYAGNRLGGRDLELLRATLAGHTGQPWLEVDCALVAPLARAPLPALRRRGVHGCTAGRRICTVWPAGDVTPCSFLPALVAGNVRHTAFAALWQAGQGWQSLRASAGSLPVGCPACASPA